MSEELLHQSHISTYLNGFTLLGICYKSEDLVPMLQLLA